MAAGKGVKASNIKDIRQLLGFTQEEFAYLVKISSVYLSQLETGNRPINQQTSEKIANGLSWLSTELYYDESDQGKAPVFRTYFPIDAMTIRANHIASFYPRDTQEKILKLIHEKNMIDLQLDLILNMGDIESASKIDNQKTKPSGSLEEKIRKLFDMTKEEDPFNVKKMIEDKVSLVKDLYTKRKNMGASYKKGKYLVDDLEPDYELFFRE